MTIRIGIVGYGNLGKGVESAISASSDMEVCGIFTRRDVKSLLPHNANTPVYHIDDAIGLKDKFDVMILCGGSANDLPTQSVQFAKHFNIIDSFDTHAKINEHFDRVDASCQEGQTVAIISSGWDPGMFSLNRLYAEAILPTGSTYTFWGKGVSQGHSDAIRRIEGVKDARQYTIPIDEALDQVRSGVNPELSVREKHIRECFVVAKEGADTVQIEKTIKEMPNYFADYDTYVNFISEEELQQNHAGIPHGGFVIHSGNTGWQQEHNHVIEYSLKLDSNPEFTSSVLVAYARAAYRLHQEGKVGCMSVFDIAPSYLHPEDAKTLRKRIL